MSISTLPSIIPTGKKIINIISVKPVSSDLINIYGLHQSPEYVVLVSGFLFVTFTFPESQKATTREVSSTQRVTTSTKNDESTGKTSVLLR